MNLLTEKKTNRNDHSVILDQQTDLTHIHDEDTIRTMEKMKNIDIEYSNKNIEPPEEIKIEDSDDLDGLYNIEEYESKYNDYLQTEQESEFILMSTQC